MVWVSDPPDTPDAADGALAGAAWRTDVDVVVGAAAAWRTDAREVIETRPPSFEGEVEDGGESGAEAKPSCIERLRLVFEDKDKRQMSVDGNLIFLIHVVSSSYTPQ